MTSWLLSIVQLVVILCLRDQVAYKASQILCDKKFMFW